MDRQRRVPGIRLDRRTGSGFHFSIGIFNEQFDRDLLICESLQPDPPRDGDFRFYENALRGQKIFHGSVQRLRFLAVGSECDGVEGDPELAKTLCSGLRKSVPRRKGTLCAVA